MRSMPWRDLARYAGSSRALGSREIRVMLTVILAVAGLLGAAGCQSRETAAMAHGPKTLLVCNASTKPCPAVAHYRTIQAAVNSGRPGDWVLIWPGVYHENDAVHHAGVWVTTPDLHIRGMDRGTVIVDGSHGPASAACPSDPALQNFTPRDGIVVWKTSGVTIQNLTVCDYLAGPGGVHGSQIWWAGDADTESAGSNSGGSNSGDGAADPDEFGLGAFGGSYLTTTSSYHPADVHSQHLAEFGIFVGDASGPGQITDSYASNMANAAFYVGACGRSCNTTLARDHGTNSAAGYLGTNSGGRLLIESSVFDRNRTGMVLLSLNTDDLPPPQDGRCPGATVRSCTRIEDNRITDNDNADAPAFAINPPIGVGVAIQGGSFDTVTRNLIAGNGSWGVLTSDNVDLLSNQPGSHCQGGVPHVPAGPLCLLRGRGNQISGNTFSQDGTFGNVTNGDLATESVQASTTPRNCFFGNHASAGPLTSSPAHIQATAVDGQPCGGASDGSNALLLEQLGCADGSRCTAAHASYPRSTAIDSVAIPVLPSMPRPCAGLPRNGFC
jgi:hypothetical protein